MPYYTGVGSRQTPSFVLEAMSMFAVHMLYQGWILRTGNAQGADAAFAGFAGNNCHMFYPSPGQGSSPEYPGVWLAARDIAAQHHPAWNRCTEFARKLHTRNVFQVLGPSLNEPSRFLICWTPHGEGGGGTGQAIRIARTWEVPVFDLGVYEHEAPTTLCFDAITFAHEHF